MAKAKEVSKEKKEQPKDVLRKVMAATVASMGLPNGVALLGTDRASVFFRTSIADVEVTVIVKKDKVDIFDDENGESLEVLEDVPELEEEL